MVTMRSVNVIHIPRVINLLLKTYTYTTFALVDF